MTDVILQLAQLGFTVTVEYDEDRDIFHFTLIKYLAVISKISITSEAIRDTDFAYLFLQECANKTQTFLDEPPITLEYGTKK